MYLVIDLKKSSNYTFLVLVFLASSHDQSPLQHEIELFQSLTVTDRNDTKCALVHSIAQALNEYVLLVERILVRRNLLVLDLMHFGAGLADRVCRLGFLGVFAEQGLQALGVLCCGGWLCGRVRFLFFGHRHL